MTDSALDALTVITMVFVVLLVIDWLLERRDRWGEGAAGGPRNTVWTDKERQERREAAERGEPYEARQQDRGEPDGRG